MADAIARQLVADAERAAVPVNRAGRILPVAEEASGSIRPGHLAGPKTGGATAVKVVVAASTRAAVAVVAFEEARAD